MEKQADAFIARLKALIEKYEHRTDPRAKQLKERQERILKKFEETQERIKGTQTFSRDGGSVMDVFGWMNDTIMQMYANDLAAEIETGTMEDALDLYTDLQSSIYDGMSLCVCFCCAMLRDSGITGAYDTLSPLPDREMPMAVCGMQSQNHNS